MDEFDKYALDILSDLKENYGACGIKAEFESEGATYKEAAKLKHLSGLAGGLDFAIKIGGCGAIRDIHEAKDLGADFIVAPMIESSYAVKKFADSIAQVFQDESLNGGKYNGIRLLINIETTNALRNLDDILDTALEYGICGIVVGRTDLASSLGLEKSGVDCPKILEYTKKAAVGAFARGLSVAAGGGVSPSSILFFKELFSFNGAYEARRTFETRKIIFDAKKALQCPDIQDGILKAIDFELFWLRHRYNFTKTFFKEDEKRLKILDARASAQS